MIRFMEETAIAAVDPLLDSRVTTVGTYVEVTHESAAREGEVVAFSALVVEASDRLLRFRVYAQVSSRMVGQGSHERMIVLRSRFGR